jgi:adenylate cyclase class IV
MFEIEIRGRLVKADFERLTKLLGEKGKLINHYHRLSVDISPGFDPQTRSWPNEDQLDLRVKKTNEKEKISVKIGDFSAKKREEIEIDLKEGHFLEALRMFEVLGFNKGIIYYWESWEYKYEGFEVKLTQLLKDHYNWEIESSGENLDPNILAEKLKLTPFTREEYKNEIDWQNLNLHQLYSLELAEKILKENFGND